ncbi:MAG: HAD hydrolase-like protein [Candidatus Micrarchaeaceae archaeon]
MQNIDFKNFLRKQKQGKLAFFDVYGTLVPNEGYAKISSEAINFINKLYDNDFTLGIVTGCEDKSIIINILKEAKIEDLFSVIVSGEDRNTHLERLFAGIISAEKITGKMFNNEIYHFDDDYRRISSTKELGVKYFMVSDDPNAKLSVLYADYIMKDFKDENVYKLLGIKNVRKNKI